MGGMEKTELQAEVGEVEMEIPGCDGKKARVVGTQGSMLSHSCRNRILEALGKMRFAKSPSGNRKIRVSGEEGRLCFLLGSNDKAIERMEMPEI